jgi:hypothetical protein
MAIVDQLEGNFDSNMLFAIDLKWVFSVYDHKYRVTLGETIWNDINLAQTALQRKPNQLALLGGEE